MKLNTRYTSLVTLILAGAFSVSFLNAGPDPVSDLKVKEDVSGVSALEGKEKLRGSVEKSEKSAFHEIRNAYDGAYDIAVERDEEGALVVKNQEGEKILRLDSNKSILEIHDMVSFGVVAVAVAKQAGDDISISLSGAGERKDEKKWGEICAVYGFSLDSNGRWTGKISRGRLIKLAGELGGMEAVEKEVKPEEQFRIKINLPVLDASLTETLKNYIGSDKFKEDYRDRKYIYGVIYPFYKNYKDGYEWVSGKPDGLYDWGNGIRIHKNGEFFTMMDSNRGIMGFNPLWEARRIQEKLGEKGIVPTGVYVINKDTYPLEVKWGNEGTPFPDSEGGTAINSEKGIAAFDNAGYVGNQEFFGVVSFLKFNQEDFPRIQVLYDQYAQQEALDIP